MPNTMAVVQTDAFLRWPNASYEVTTCLSAHVFIGAHLQVVVSAAVRTHPTFFQISDTFDHIDFMNNSFAAAIIADWYLIHF